MSLNIVVLVLKKTGIMNAATMLLKVCSRGSSMVILIDRGLAVFMTSFSLAESKNPELSFEI